VAVSSPVVAPPITAEPDAEAGCDAGPGRYAATWLALKRLGVPRDERGQLATTIAWLMSSREPEVLGRVERWARDVRAQIERMAAREW
jgi:hypothetical protein